MFELNGERPIVQACYKELQWAAQRGPVWIVFDKHRIVCIMISRLVLIGMEFWCAKPGCNISPV